MNNMEKKLAIFLSALVFFISSSAFAQTTSRSSCEFLSSEDLRIFPKTVSLRVVNPDGLIINTRATFDIPEGITPVNLGVYAIWDPVTRKLSFTLGDFQASEEKQFLVDFEGRPGACLVFGILEGTWSPTPAVGPAEWQDQINFSLIIVESAPVPAQPAGDILSDFRNNPLIQNAAPAAALTAGALGGVAAVGIPWLNLLQLLNLASLGSLRKKPEHPWGTVFDKTTRNPISGASVRVYDAADGKLKESTTTDVDGRFGFLVAPGTYIVEASKKSFEDYKSDFVRAPEKVEEALNLEVGLLPKEAKPNLLARIGGWLRDAFQVGNPWLLVIGTFISLIIAILYPTTLHYIVLAIYLILDVIKILIDSLTSKSIGTIKNAVTAEPIPLAVVRVYEARHNWLLFTRVTNAKGHFKFLVTQGEYYVTSSRQEYKPYKSEELTVRKSDVVKLDIPMEPNSIT